jgi:hypothetical protein
VRPGSQRDATIRTSSPRWDAFCSSDFSAFSSNGFVVPELSVTVSPGLSFSMSGWK